MTRERPPARRRRGRGLRPWFIIVKLVGLAGFFGGMAALAVIGLLVEVPNDLAGWLLLKGVLRAVFWSCVFAGLVAAIIAGLALFLLHPREFLRMRWFRVKAICLVVCLPALHLTARGRVTALYAAIDDGRLEDVTTLWHQVTTAWIVAFFVMLLIAMIGRLKPRLGERIGARRVMQSHGTAQPHRGQAPFSAQGGQERDGEGSEKGA